MGIFVGKKRRVEEREIGNKIGERLFIFRVKNIFLDEMFIKRDV